jgi:hypothetical protein
MISDDVLGELESTVASALDAGDAGQLPVMGYGEISVVLGHPAQDPDWVCKRLPPFPDADSADRFAACVERYLVALADRGVDVLETEVRRVDRADGSVVMYCVQPVLPSATLAVNVARDAPDAFPALAASVVAAVVAVVDHSVGLDAQLSNWALVDGRLVYFDVTTPLMRDAAGASELDADVFLASLPWLLRAPVKRFVVPGIMARYHSPRTALLDLAANLVKERLDPLIPIVLQHANLSVTPPLTEEEVRRDYRSDARTWAALQQVRRLDRAWQRRVRRRPYPFLIPGRIQR